MGHAAPVAAAQAPRARADQDGASLSNLAGYAFLGGVFFLVSALRLGRVRRA
ncbi:hypothetical protein EES45_16655 [Streptomyces sp. ADI97-07]|nr:hypothetical protein EES45_16655 [Streptomyces sp. ADI97-07]